jgi:YD repeat-containing protein
MTTLGVSLRQPSLHWRPRVLLAVVVLGSIVTGCGRSSQRPAVIEGRRGGADVMYTFSYEGSNLSEVDYEVEGDRRETWEFKWEGGSLTELVVEPRNGDDRIYTFKREGGQLVQKVVEQGNSETTIDYVYEGGVLAEVKAETRVGGDRVSEAESAITREGGRIALIVTEANFRIGPLSFDTTEEAEFRYDDQGRIEDVRADLSGDASGRTRTDFEYNDQGRLELVEREGRDYELEYDDFGRVEEIDDEDGYTYEVEYDEGQVSGLVFDLTFIPFGGLFDLEGRGYGDYDTNTLGFILSTGAL